MHDPFPSTTDLFPLQGPWQSPSVWQESLQELPPGWAFLVMQGPLTRELRSQCPEDFHLELHRRFSTQIPASVSPLLHLDPTAPVWQREVWLACGARRLVFARSWIPEGVLDDPGETPLGDQLFAAGSPSERLYLEIAPVAAGDGNTLWARRSLYSTGCGHLLVGEVLLCPFVQGRQGE